MQFKLAVSGRVMSVDAPADMPLLWALWDMLDLHEPNTALGTPPRQQAGNPGFGGFGEE